MVKPEPVLVTPLGSLVNVQLPAGNPVSSTVPVEVIHVGCVIVPITGAVGNCGCGLITTGPVSAEIHPDSLVTVKVYEPAASPLTVVLVPVPLVVILPGIRVRVHVPDEGRLFRTTLPVGFVQERCVIVPIDGVAGVAYTERVYTEVAARHGAPRGLSVVRVISTILPPSPAAGV